MKNYIVHLHDLPTYAPPSHSLTTNRRLLGPGPEGSSRFEVIYGEIEYGGQADPHVHEIQEQAFYIIEGQAEIDIDGKSHVIGPQDFVYLPPGTIHRITPLEGATLKALIIYSPPLSSFHSFK